MDTLYGNRLLSVPTAIRFKFQNETGKSWPDVSEDERREFLMRHEEIRIQQQQDQEEYFKNISQKKEILITEKEKAAELKKIYLANKKSRDKIKQNKLKSAINEKRARNKKTKEFKKKRSQMLKNLKKQQKSHR